MIGGGSSAFSLHHERNARMSGAARGAAWALVAVVWLSLAPGRPATAQQPPADPFAPTWSNLAGARVFGEKGCGLCHAIRGLGATAGPDLSRLERKSFFDLGAAMSNHLRGVNVRKPPLGADDVASLISFLFTLQYHDQPGDAQAGEQLFGSKGCAQCHAVGGKGGQRGPGLDFLKRADSPVLVAAALWNHGPEMAEQLRAAGIPRPSFEPGELANIVAYIQSAGRVTAGGGDRVAPGQPDRGAKVFAAKRCAECHAVGGRGARIGPALGRGQHVSLTEFAARMWNHGPGMWAAMQKKGVQVPRLTGQEMADVVAHLYVSHYFDESADAGRGRQLVDAKGCLGCHTAQGRGGPGGKDLAAYPGLRSSAGTVAAMWNHPRWVEAQRREVPWPVLTGQELADMAAYLASLQRSAAPKPKS
jgi:mono/diheme cytochrome c family protein